FFMVSPFPCSGCMELGHVPHAPLRKLTLTPEAQHKSVHRIVVANVHRNNFLVINQELKINTIGQID
ncbi:MAG: hypothetical protein WCD00_00560, partial [Desulfuromonadaceae bacterium]